MGLIDQIADKASDKIAEHIKSSGGSAVQQEKTGGAVTAGAKAGAPQTMQSDVPTSITPDQKIAMQQAQPVTGFPSTNPAARELGLGETDIAPGMNYPQPAAPATVPTVPVPTPNEVMGTAGPQAVAGTPNSNLQMAQPDAIGSNKAVDPVKDATAKPDFWKSVMDVAGKTGKSIIELLGDFAAGYSHQTSSPTEQRLAREHDLRMQGNQLQAQKDLMSMNQGFQKQQADLDREFQNKWNTTTDERERAALKQQYDMQTRQIEVERQQMVNNYSIAMLNLRWSQMEKTGQSGGAGSFYKFGE